MGVSLLGCRAVFCQTTDMRRVALLLLLALSPAGVRCAGNDFGRDPEATYFQDYPDLKPITLKVLKVTAVYADRTRNAVIKNFLPDESVELLAYAPQTLFVKNSRSGYEGWVPAENLSVPPPADLEKLRALVAEDKKITDAIKNKEVIPGMNFAQVQAALGKPNSKTFREDENGRFDKWSYVDYEVQYQTQYQNQPYYNAATRSYFNNPVQVQVAIKVPVGSINVEFRKGRVTAFENVKNQ